MISKKSFNPRARAGRDSAPRCRSSRLSGFNPRARAGRDLVHSTHRWSTAQFQSTRPRGARLYGGLGKHPLCGVSIHAPARGATRWYRAAFAAPSCFNPRARAGRDLVDSCPWSLAPCFNPRARAGRDLESGDVVTVRAVSIHAPARGATRGIRSGHRHRHVSIHAPARGATIGKGIVRHGIRVSIHAPARGATRMRDRQHAGRACFNPRARAGRDSTGRRFPLCSNGFNPRARAGRDSAGSRNTRHRRGFNPRARAGRDCLLAGQIPTIRQSNLTSKPQQS